MGVGNIGVMDAPDQKCREANDKGQCPVSCKFSILQCYADLQEVQEAREEDAVHALALVVGIHLLQKRIEVADVHPPPERFIIF